MSVPELENVIVLYRHSDSAPSRGGDPNVKISHERLARVQRYVFPVNPESVRLSMGREAQDVPLLRYGNTVRPGAVQPLEITFEGLIPGTRHEGESWVTPGAQLYDPWVVARMLRDWQQAEPLAEKGRQQGLTPTRITVSHTGGFIDFWCVITQFDPEIRAREPGDLYFTFSAREMTPLPRIRTVRRGSTGQARATTRVNGKPLPATVKTKAGETLHQVCKRVYGSAVKAYFTALYKANKAKVGADYSRRLPANMVLKVPRVTGVGPSK